MAKAKPKKEKAAEKPEKSADPNERIDKLIQYLRQTGRDTPQLRNI